MVKHTGDYFEQEQRSLTFILNLMILLGFFSVWYLADWITMNHLLKKYLASQKLQR